MHKDTPNAVGYQRFTSRPNDRSSGRVQALRRFTGERLPNRFAAFEDLYRTHGARMKSLAYNLLGNATDAEDAVQEAFLKACRADQGFRGAAQPWTWICRILINTCYDVGRKRVTHRERQTDELTHAEHVGMPLRDHPLRLTLEHLVANLSPRMREVFLLFEVEGLSHREIADVLGIAEGTSKSTLADAKRRLATGLRNPVGASEVAR